MSGPLTAQKLDRIGQLLVRWNAQLRFVWSLAALAIAVWAIALIDFFLRLGQVDRYVSWGLILLLAVGGLVLVRAAFARRFTREGVAATIEKAFPQLDNHLINYLQLSNNPEGDPLKAAYVQGGAPAVQNLDLRLMKNARAHRRGAIALAVSLSLLALPALFIGQAWGVALWRTINPFTDASLSLTRIVDVSPKDSTVLQGEFVMLSCTVDGFRGHEVRVEIDPGDAAKTTYSLGKIVSTGPQPFSHRHKKVATGLRYRFRAGDSEPSPWYRIDTRPPSAFTSIRCNVRPPAHTGLGSRDFDARADRLEIPAGSELAVIATCNNSLKSAKLTGTAPEPVPLSPGEDSKTWSGTVQAVSGTSLRLEAVDVYGAPLQEEIPVTLQPDRAPVVEIVAPAGHAILPPGERPRISFRISDDYGLSHVWLEQMPQGNAGGAGGVEKMRWTIEKTSAFEQTWVADGPVPPGREMTFRVVAMDNQPEAPNTSSSAPVLFTTPGVADLAKQREELERKAFAGLQEVIKLQKENISQTEAQQRNLTQTPVEKWAETAHRQTSIRSLTKGLLENPVNPLGSLTGTVKKLYLEEMFLAIKSLESVSTAEPGAKSPFVAESLACQNKILRQLNSASLAASKAQVDRRVAGLAALIEELIRGQSEIIKQTREFAGSKDSASASGKSGTSSTSPVQTPN